MDAVVDVEVPVGFASGRDATAGIIHRWRTVSHRRRLRLKMTVRHCAVQHRRGQDAMSVELTAVIQIFHRGDARDIYVPPPFQPSQVQLPITGPENEFRGPRLGERAPPVLPRPSSH